MLKPVNTWTTSTSRGAAQMREGASSTPDVFYLLLPELKSRGKTVVVISHDDRFYYLADRILRLDYGKLRSDSSLHSAVPARTIEAAG